MATNRQIIYILALALALRLVLINQSLWLDEAIGIQAAKNLSHSEIIHKFSPGNFHPPLHFLILKTWGTILGFSEISTRFLSISFSLITIWLVFAISRHIPSLKSTPPFSFPIIAALILATNPLHIYYSQDAWVYSLATFFSCLSIYSFLLFQAKSSPRNFIMLIVSFIASIYTYYPLALVLIAIFIFGLISRTRVKGLALALILSLISYLPWLPTLKIQLNIASQVRKSLPIWWQVLGKTSLKSVILVWVKFLIGRISFYTKKGYIAYVVVASIFPLITLFQSWIKKSHIWLIWSWLLIPLSLAFILGLIGTGFQYFRLIIILPAFCILIAFGITSLSPSWKRFSLLTILATQVSALIIFWINPRFHRENWRDAVYFIKSNSNSSTISVFINYSQSDPYRYYAPGVPVYSARDWQDHASDHLWLFRYVQPMFDPQDNLRQSIESSGFTKIDEKDFNGVTIWEYRKT